MPGFELRTNLRNPKLCPLVKVRAFPSVVPRVGNCKICAFVFVMGRRVDLVKHLPLLDCYVLVLPVFVKYQFLPCYQFGHSVFLMSRISANSSQVTFSLITNHWWMLHPVATDLRVILWGGGSNLLVITSPEQLSSSPGRWKSLIVVASGRLRTVYRWS